MQLLRTHSCPDKPDLLIKCKTWEGMLPPKELEQIATVIDFFNISGSRKKLTR
jgi:hypothetical protein